MTARDYIPQKGDKLRRNTFYTAIFPYNIEIEKITRSGHVHFYEIIGGKRTGHHSSTTLHTIRKLYMLHTPNIQITEEMNDDKTNI